MTLSITCPRCDAAITADDENDLVVRVQAHVGDHAAGHSPSRKHILSRLYRQDAERRRSETGRRSGNG
ncbi:MAG: DUF1059 domain-containing protein [Chloroflexota bacterium]|nr:DUF1059 domain-containing protein [Chloroflexota bacterium]